MINKLSSIATLLTYFADIILLLISLMYCYRPWAPKYLRSFPLYLIITIISDHFFTFTTKINLNWNPFQVYDVLSFIYLYYFMGFLFKSKKMKTVALILGIIYVSVSIFMLIQYGRKTPLIMYVIQPFILIFYFLSYFFEVLNNPSQKNLTGEPSFWIVTAFLVYSSVFIPVFVFAGYAESRGYHDLSISIYSLNNFAGILGNILCIKGLTCVKKPSF